MKISMGRPTSSSHFGNFMDTQWWILTMVGGNERICLDIEMAGGAAEA